MFDPKDWQETDANDYYHDRVRWRTMRRQGWLMLALWAGFVTVCVLWGRW